MTLVLTLALALTSSAADEKILAETLTAGGRERTYSAFVPDNAVKGSPAPLLVILHGSGRDGRIMVEHWKGRASKEGIILAAPDALQKDRWQIETDGPDFLHALVEHLKRKHPIDPRRVYVFGHSAGAIHGLNLGVLETEYFAAIAAHAGIFFEEFSSFAAAAPRKIPMAIWVGTNDPLFPLRDVRATRDVLTKLGFPVELTEIPRHTHNYYSRSGDINRQAWDFLKKHRLEADPKYQEYEIRK